MKNRAVVLLSGGLDSAVTLYFAANKGFKCNCLIFDYGQRHHREIECAKKVAACMHVAAQVIKINLPWKGSSLLNKKLKIPELVNSPTRGFTKFIPSTYVPGRNIIFLSFALSYAEAIGAEAIFIGAHAQDYSGYPDCRPEFYRAFSIAAKRGTKRGVEKRPIKIETPLINKDKAEIIKLGAKLNVPFDLTHSCYRGTKKPCGKCDSCYFRQKGFSEAGLVDPTIKL
ncbi:MAG: 7-cyano-7-deazaguanine synthase QueC [Candidatus Omnitrophota bacterium]|jgi:7-cyano-7-deazaguanine synthase